MPVTASKRLRLTLALLIGVPGTVVFLPLAAFIGYAGLDATIDALRGGPWNYSPPPTLQSGLLNTTWGAAGVTGLVGFWLWVWQPRWSSTQKGKFLIALLVATGMVAMAPLAMALLTSPFEASVWGLLSGLGLIGGTVVIYTQLRRLDGAA